MKNVQRKSDYGMRRRKAEVRMYNEKEKSMTKQNKKQTKTNADRAELLTEKYEKKSCKS